MKLKISDIIKPLDVFLNLKNPSEELKGIREITETELDETELKDAFSHALKSLRAIEGVSLNKLSKAVDIPNASISRYENGLVIPTIPQAIKLAAYFKLTIEIMIFMGVLGKKGGNIESMYKSFLNLKSIAELAQMGLNN